MFGVPDASDSGLDVISRVLAHEPLELRLDVAIVLDGGYERVLVHDVELDQIVQVRVRFERAFQDTSTAVGLVEGNTFDVPAESVNAVEVHTELHLPTRQRLVGRSVDEDLRVDILDVRDQLVVLGAWLGAAA